MSERTSEPVTTGWDEHDDPSQDTIALLQDEVARLEAELQARDEATPPNWHAPDDSGADAEEEARRAAELAAELAVRDETIAILLEQSRVYEEAAAAQRAEWEQLHQWVEEVERRVEGRDTDDSRLLADLDAERARAEAVRRQAESDRRDWAAQRAGLEQEAHHLRDQLARWHAGPDAAEDETAFLALASENRKLRTACAGLERRAAEAEEVDRKLAATLVEIEQARRDLRQLADERERERIEHEAELASLRSRLAAEALHRPAEPAPPPTDAPAPAPVVHPLDADERIRAFRQHLKELHEHEASQRAGKTLSSRLSRLWNHTGPR